MISCSLSFETYFSTFMGLNVTPWGLGHELSDHIEMSQKPKSQINTPMKTSPTYQLYQLSGYWICLSSPVSAWWKREGFSSMLLCSHQINQSLLSSRIPSSSAAPLVTTSILKYALPTDLHVTTLLISISQGASTLCPLLL